MSVAALYIDPRGPYPALLGPELCWDEKRDARTYAGPWPVVAHPPCGPWGRLKHLYQGAEHFCAPYAVGQVRLWGGVLEHPAHSQLWAHQGLPKPGAGPDEHGGFTVDVDQCEWGHVARKRTWVYVVGFARECLDIQAPFPGRQPTHWVSGFMRAGSRGKPPPGIKICSAQQRRRTPVAFAEWLISLAKQAQR